MTTLIVARHGETDWNREGRFQGHADPPLNELGREQSRGLARELAGEPIVLVYTSPLRRAAETAGIVAAELGLSVEPLDGLREIDVGSWSGRTRTEIAEQFPDGYARWLDYGHGWDDGETYEQLGERVRSALHDIAGRHSAEVVLVVTHGGPSRVAQAHAAGISYGEARRHEGVLANCGTCRLGVEGAEFRRLD